MKIEASSVNMSSKHGLSEVFIQKESLKYWKVGQSADSEGHSTTAGKSLGTASVILDLSDEGKKLWAQGDEAAEKVDCENEVELSISEKDRQKIQLFEIFFEKLTGKRIKFHVLDRVRLKADDAHSRKAQSGAVQSPGREGWGLEYHYHRSYSEKESMSFNFEGVVKTSDGREISFSLSQSMSRQFTSSFDFHLRAGDAAIDPLVINFDGSVPGLTEDKYSFDIDCDGTPDQISFVTKGSGFLALDINNDGTINDGRELFGPNTGNGFSELKQHDSDNNNWIDENDPIFEKLRIWIKDKNGNDQLFALGQKGIGAIYLGNIQTPFSIKDSQNELMGNIRTSGVFINEDGTAGVVQQIDLAV